ncbi:MAG: WYL domain-containing protein, partial [Clostridia bacterium]|nr:WYL domain-containing protein [Clostridia bacterium]
LHLSEGLIGVILDRFGRDVPILRGENSTFSVVVPVTVSPQFFGWLASLGRDASLVSPPEVKAEYVQYLKDTLAAQE